MTDGDAPEVTPTDGHGGNGSGDGEEGDLAAVDAALRERFTWYPVAKKEFRDTVRSRLIWVLSAVFVVIFALPAFLGLYFDLGQLARQQGQTLTTDFFFASATRFGSALIPIIAIVVGYAAVVGERESGSLKVLLSLPFSRADVLVGKVVGRSATVAVPILLGFVVSVVVLIPAGVQVSPVGFLLGAVLTALLGVVFVALAVGFSAAARTSRRAIVATVGLYVYFFIFWNAFANSVGTLLQRYLDVATPPTLQVTVFLKLLNPTQAYQTLVDSALGQTPLAARAAMFGRLRQSIYCEEALGGNMSMSGAGAITCNPVGGGLPVYFSDAAVLGYFLLWLVVPLVLGYRLFDAADL